MKRALAIHWLLTSPWPYVCVAALGLALFFGLRELGPGSREPLAALGGQAPSDELSVVFVLIDTLRADRLGCYGHARQTSPNIDALAQHGIRFSQVQSQSSWTKASMASLWTGAYPAATGVLRLQHAIPNESTTAAEILREGGFRTAGIWRNGWVAPNFGFAQGFDTYLRTPPSRTRAKLERYNPSAHPLLGTDADATDSAIEFLRAFRDTRFFLYLHYMDVHQYVYDDTSTLFGTAYSDAYDNAIHWVDANVGVLVNELIELQLLRRTLLVIASDHGEAFLEHGQEGHARNLYREVTEVPLIFLLPSPLPGGLVIEPLVQNVDIWPTLLDLLGLPALPGAQGKSLRPLLGAAAGEEMAEASRLSQRPAFAQLDQTWAWRRREPRPLIAVQDRQFRLIHRTAHPNADELFDREADPHEQRNVLAEHPEVAADLRKKIRRYLEAPSPGAAAPDEVEIDELRLEQLRALGYMGGR